MANSTMATKEYLLAVVSAVLSGKEIPDLPQDVDVTQFVRLAFTNAVQGIVFSAFAENPGALPEALFARRGADADAFDFARTIKRRGH